jgi:hypothetical protein
MVYYLVFGGYGANNGSIKRYREREEVRTFYVDRGGRLSVSLNKGVLLEGFFALALRQP